MLARYSQYHGSDSNMIGVSDEHGILYRAHSIEAYQSSDVRCMSSLLIGIVDQRSYEPRMTRPQPWGPHCGIYGSRTSDLEQRALEAAVAAAGPGSSHSNETVSKEVGAEFDS